MKLDDLKKSWFGYEKAGVYQYISELEETCAAKLAQQEAQAKQAEESYQARLRQMEEELRQLRQKYEKQQEQALMVSSVLLDAKSYAEQLRQNAQDQDAQERRQLEGEYTQARREIDRCRQQADRLRDIFRTLLEEMDRQAEEYTLQAEAEVQALSDEGNMALFQRSL